MVRLFKHYISYHVVLLGAVDLLVLFLAGEAAWHVRISQMGIAPGAFASRFWELLGFAVVIWLAMVAVGSYSPDSLRSVRFATARLLVAVSLGVLGIAFLNLLLPGATLWRSVLLFAMLFAIAALVMVRIVWNATVKETAFQRRILVLGAGSRAQRLHRLSQRQGSGFTIVSFVKMGQGDAQIDGAIRRDDIGDLGQFVTRHGASEVVLAMEERRGSLPLKDLVRIKTKGILVNEFSSFLERETGRLDLDTLDPSWLIFSDGFSSGRFLSSVFKRIFDIFASLLLLTVSLPLIVIFAILVKLDSSGPAFYRQTRVGLYGQPFRIAKLRSMRQDAEVAGAQWADEDDPRITRIGRFIRNVRIDELPQLWNVLSGTMSFVGPRPERPEFVADLEADIPYYAERHMVKPGITGWAQINYPYGASVDDARHKLEYDLYYAKNYTPFLDILILLQTLRVVLWPAGAR